MGIDNFVIDIRYTFETIQDYAIRHQYTLSILGEGLNSRFVVLEHPTKHTKHVLFMDRVDGSDFMYRCIYTDSIKKNLN